MPFDDLMFEKQLHNRRVRCGTPEQKVNVVHGEQLPNLTGCHSNVPWATPNEWQTNHHHPYACQICKLRKIGPGYGPTEIFGVICRFSPYRC